jgi:hypothetical protein
MQPAQAKSIGKLNRDLLIQIYKTLDARQAAVRAEQNSVGNVVIESVAGSASGFLNNRMALDNAARSAFARWR